MITPLANTRTQPFASVGPVPTGQSPFSNPSRATVVNFARSHSSAMNLPKVPRRPALQACIAILAFVVFSAAPLIAQPITPASYSDVQEVPPASDLFIVTQIFQGDQTDPIEVHRIAFKDGVFYDFPSQPEQPWTIFDLPKSRVILLDRKRQQQTSLSTEDLLRLTVQSDTKITDPEQRQRFGMDAEVRPQLNPHSANSQSSRGQRFELSYDRTRYEVIAEKPAEPAWAYQYGQFVDWACRLNIARPQGVPPFARMRLNQAMVDQALYGRQINVELSRVVGSDSTPVTIRLRSETSLSSEISDSIADQIKQAQSLQVLFNAVPWDQYES